MSFQLKTVLGVAAIEAVLLFLLVFSSNSALSASLSEELEKRATTTARCRSPSRVLTRAGVSCTSPTVPGGRS